MEDRLRNIIDVLVDIDDPAAGAELARRAHLSRFHFDRVSAAILGESPAAFRRRLLLERAVPGDERRQTMDLTTRLVEHDNWLAEQLISAASTLDDTALDEPVPVSPPTDSFAEDSPSIRSMLNRLVFTKEMWSAAIGGHEFEEATDTSLCALRERLARAGSEFATLVSDVARRDAWDTAFVDATCDPPVSFTFGAAVAHVLTRDSYRRQVVAAALRERGIDVAADPIAWERKGD
jgi:GNAT superfamily N-acetyltransferase